MSFSATNSIPRSVLTVGEVLLHYEQQQNTSAGKRLVSNLKTVLRRYLPPPENFQSYDNEERGHTEMMVTTLSAEAFLASDPLAQFEARVQSAVEQGSIKSSVVRTTYRPALVKFLDAIAERLASETRESDNSAAQSMLSKSKRQLIDPSQCAPRLKPQITLQQAVQGGRSHKENPYSLYIEQLPANVLAEITELQHFWTDKEVPDRQDDQMRLGSFKENIVRSILFFFGWLHYLKQWDLGCLKLDLLLTNSAQDGIEDLGLMKEFIAWGINHRGNTYGWATVMVKAPLAIAKWKYAAQSKRSLYRDIDIVEHVRSYLNSLSKKYSKEPSPLDEKKDLKIMTFEQGVAIVEHLRSCCAPYLNNHARRSQMAVTRAWQRYLIVAILTYCPLRQREIRELELGRTLIREDGYRVHLKPDDNKTGDEREFRLVDVLPSQVITDLDSWLAHYRADFVKQLQAASTSLEDWFKFLNYPPELLESRIQEVSQQIDRLGDAKSSREFVVLERKLKKLQAIPEARLQIPKRLKQQFVFLTFGGTTGKDVIGLPLERENLTCLVKTAVFDASSILVETEHPLFKGLDPRQTNPHFYRNNGITHERRHGDPDKRQAFHKMIGNSVAEGDRTYNEMTASEKTMQAAGWWDSQSTDATVPQHLQSILQQLSQQDKQLLKKFLK